MIYKRITLTIFVFLAPGLIHLKAQTVIYVDADATGSSYGTSWDDAYIDLQDALAWAANDWGGSNPPLQIWVAYGVYKPVTPADLSSVTEDERLASFQLMNNVEIYGGFIGIENSLGERHLGFERGFSILSGDIDENDDLFKPTVDSDNNENTPTQTDHINGNNSYNVVDGSFTDNSAVLDGFGIRGGKATIVSGGVGGMFNFRGDPILRNIVFEGNHGIDGGGMFNRESNPVLVNVYFHGNLAEGDGGGMFNSAGNPTLVNVIFFKNNTLNSGGGIYNFDDSNPVLTNVTITDNIAQFGAGGIGNRRSNPILKNVIIWGNKAGLSDTSSPQSSIYNFLSAPQISYSLIANSGGSANWISDIGIDNGNNIDSDPLFVDRCRLITSFIDVAVPSVETMGLQLQSASPAINAGDPSTDLSIFPTDFSIFPGGTSDPKDIDKNLRVYTDQEQIIDIGAVENQGVSNSPSVSITGSPGWRMMGMPIAGVTVSDLAESNLVQGIQGLNYDASDPNLYVWNPSANTPDFLYSAGAFEVPASGATELQPGQGFIWYMYGPESRADIFESRNFPLKIELPGNGECVDYSLGTLAADWHLIANPYVRAIKFDRITDGSGSLLNVTGQVWNPNNGSEGSYELTTSETLNNTLSVWQGAFINLSSETEVVIPQDFVDSYETTFLKDQGQPLAGQVEFMLEGESDGESIVDKAAILYFHENASEEWDGYDVPKLTPLSQSWATVNLVGEREGEPLYKSQHSLPYDFTGTEEIPVDIQLQNTSGTFTLSWPVVSNLPQAELWLLDRQTGERYDLTRPGSVEFIPEAGKQASASIETNPLKLPEPEPMRFKQNSEPRFVIQVNPEAVREELPAEFTLNQNYPNPFNPTTVISYELPQAADVRLEVFDIGGRQVATLVNDQVSAGLHTVNFDAGSLSSGVYLYRMKWGSSVLTRKLTILK
jgi:hypothetical protein